MENVIARLFPFRDEKYEYVRKLIEDVRDTHRFVPASIKEQSPAPDSTEIIESIESIESTESIESIESTVIIESTESQDDARDLEELNSLELRFDDPTYKNGKGIMFGWNRTKCDIVLPNIGSIDQEHCYLTFDDNNCLILRDISRYGTTVMYNGEGGFKRKHFTWILGGEEFTDDRNVITIQVHKKVQFRIVVPKNISSSDPYIKNVATFKAQMKELGDLPLGLVDLKSPPSTRQAGSRVETGTSTIETAEPWSGSKDTFFTSHSIILKWSDLGKGAFGTVESVFEVSTGLYARKRFAPSTTFDWVAEARKMANLKHPNIVQLKALVTNEPYPGIYLEYVSNGTLEYQRKQEALSVSELEQTLFQGLSALEYLHGQRVVHRDIKLENILVESRSPWHIKLADFGLSKEGSSLHTLCGTPYFAAPEIIAIQDGSRSLEESYTAAVDIWSFGVVMLKCGWENIPKYPRTAYHRLAPEWPEMLIRSLRAWDPDGFDVLYNMLVLDPQQRASAGECLEQIRRDRVANSAAIEQDRTVQKMSIDTPTTGGGPSAADTQHLDTDELGGTQARQQATAIQTPDLGARTNVQKRPRSSMSTPSTTVPGDGRLRKRVAADREVSVSIHDSEIEAYIVAPRRSERSTAQTIVQTREAPATQHNSSSAMEFDESNGTSTAQEEELEAARS